MDNTEVLSNLVSALGVSVWGWTSLRVGGPVSCQASCVRRVLPLAAFQQQARRIDDQKSQNIVTTLIEVSHRLSIRGSGLLGRRCNRKQMLE